ncbi:hypothetical protein LBW89_13115 [Paenibacillus sp. alder61]|uniref:Uncharacterized protein n=1 Tax=Paenibacillus faecis TaxID=862114 RepID=A0A5D0CSQ8_9BACL|nr:MULTISPECIES: hypothetical protein [Paenibacillus]MCA1293961.1 hypothetical protein [Paenibacillus sp. alder61]TYA11847.1 hypothetical protein FRY98_13920 [Paenibacillus faecis]
MLQLSEMPLGQPQILAEGAAARAGLWQALLRLTAVAIGGCRPPEKLLELLQIPAEGVAAASRTVAGAARTDCRCNRWMRNCQSVETNKKMQKCRNFTGLLPVFKQKDAIVQEFLEDSRYGHFSDENPCTFAGIL